MVKLEGIIAKLTGLVNDRTGGDIEYRILYRSEGTAYFLMREVQGAGKGEKQQKGELVPHLAYIMNWLSRPSPGDFFLDPFCGHGAVSFQRLLHFPAETVFSSDIDAVMAEKTAKKLCSKTSGNIVVKKLDLFNLRGVIGDIKVDRIVTDPPWGFYDEIDDIRGFYAKMLETFGLIIKDTGRIVILTARKEEFTSALMETNIFSVSETFNILVSGKKSAIYIVEKNRRQSN